MTSGKGSDWEVNFKIAGESGLEMTREISGADWQVCTGEGTGKVDFATVGEEMLVCTVMPMMKLSYSRFSGDLRGIFVSGLDLAVLAGTKMALATEDWANVTDLKQSQEDRLFGLQFTPEGMELVLVNALGRKLVKVINEAVENLGMDGYGRRPGVAEYSWWDNLGFLKGRVGLEVFANQVILYYEKGEGDNSVRRDIMGIPRIISGTVELDRVVTAGMPKEDDLLEFMERVYVPLI
jgi:hypothetical protein